MPPSGARSKVSRVTSFMKPSSPSKIGAGPVMPSAASWAAQTPLRAALAKAQPFHMLNSPARLPQRDVAHTGNPERMSRLRRIESHEFASGRRGRDGPVSDVIDALLAETRGVAETALDLVGQHRGGDEIRPGGVDRVADGEDGREVVARMGRLQRQVRIVEVEIADQETVDERRPFGTAAAAAEETGAGIALDAQGTAAATA